MKKQLKCYIYTRVSTSMQVDGYSLDAQKDKLHKYADYQDMIIAGEYSDEGKSGKSVEGRPQFQQMLQDIETGKDNIDFVLVFKLSRFGRNAADVLSSLQRMQDFGVNLICVEDGIDSSKDAGKLMISVLSAVAEIERENILVQTMEGRRQKAREGKWNGGFAPYGYQLINGELHIAEDEAEVIRIIYDKYANTTMGIAAIATFLNNSGYKKKLRQNNTIEGFSTSFVKGVLDNPVYCGKLAFGRRKNEKIPGTRNEYHVVKQDNYMLNDGIHEAIVSEELWDRANKLMDARSTTYITEDFKTKTIGSKKNCNPLTSKIVCGICGSSYWRSTAVMKNGTQVYWCCKEYVQRGRKTKNNRSPKGMTESKYEVKNAGCDNIHLKEEDLDNVIYEIAGKLYEKSREDIFSVATSILGQIISDGSEIEDKEKSLNQEISKVKSNRETLLDRYLDNKIDDDIYKIKDDSLKEKVCELEEELKVLESKKQSISSKEERIKNLEDEIKSISDYNLSVNNIKEHIEKIEVFPTYLMFYFDIFDSIRVNINKINYRRNEYNICL